MNRNIHATELFNYPCLDTQIPIFSLKTALQLTLQFFIQAFAAAGKFYLDNPAVTQHSRLSMNPWEHRASTPKACRNGTESPMEDNCPPLSS